MFLFDQEAHGTRRISHTQNFSVAAARPNSALYHQKMDKANPADAARGSQRARILFTPARAKVRGAVEFCERMGM